MTPAVKHGLKWGVTVVFAASAALIGAWEGKRNETYLDVVGVKTVCFGSTNPKYAVMGKRYTDQECLDILQEDVEKHYGEMQRCVHHPMPLHSTVAVLSMFFNMGGTKMCASTLVRQINAGLPPTTYCEQIPRWNQAGGKIWQGLVNRRADERLLCLGQGKWMQVVRDVLGNLPPTKLIYFTVE